MKQPSVYLKMRVLGCRRHGRGGRTRDERIHAVAAMTFPDEEGNPGGSSPGGPFRPGSTATRTAASPA